MKSKSSNETKSPKTLAEYFAWAVNTLGTDFMEDKNKRVYEVNINNYFNTISNHDFFKGLQPELEKWDAEYHRTTTTHLLMERVVPPLLQKPYSSAVDKSFRVNILWNEEFPKPPKKGWVTAENLHAYFNDVIRCCIVCKFIDGPRFITERLMKYANTAGLGRRQYSQERDEGYYAYHFYVAFPVTLVDKEWQATDSQVEIEIQVTTQLQEVLRSMTHNFYAQSRLEPDEDFSKWKWEFTTNRFRVGYLSHTLHLMEAIILESRDNMRQQDSQSSRQE